jgi:DNA-binding transcriptional regulator GbsR (MarR family)
MVLWILFISLLSFIFIYIAHNIFLFFKSTLTTPKIKDYIHSPTRSYDEIYKTLQKMDKNNPSTEKTTLIEDLSDKEKMKYDLKTFLKNQIQTI